MVIVWLVILVVSSMFFGVWCCLFGGSVVVFGCVGGVFIVLLVSSVCSVFMLFSCGVYMFRFCIVMCSVFMW